MVLPSTLVPSQSRYAHPGNPGGQYACIDRTAIVLTLAVQHGQACAYACQLGVPAQLSRPQFAPQGCLPAAAPCWPLLPAEQSPLYVQPRELLLPST